MTKLREPGEQVMVGRGMRMDGTWARMEPATCARPTCRAPEMFIDHDSKKHRVETCANCGGIRAISKGETSWWYHDTKLPEDMPPRFYALIYDREPA